MKFFLKKVYSITIRGKEELQTWMLEDEPSLPQHKDIFKLRLYFSENLPHKNLLKKFENRQEKFLSLLARYTLKIKEYTPESIAPKYFGDYLLLKGAIASLKSQLE
ncbi:MAG: padR1 [Firmicutes bacterium]|nr:padR1 [Bacillota bacterium]